MNELLDGALSYAARGWPVLPLRPRDKRPASANGLHDATCDPEVIRAWWEAHPDYNVGVRTGVGCDVVDADSDTAWDAVLSLDPAHRGPVSATGRGAHLFYAPTGTGNKVGVLDGVDYRGAGGYVVVPPSLHPNGRPYEWLVPPDAPMSAPSVELAELLTAPPTALEGPTTAPQAPRDLAPYAAKVLTAECARVAAAGEGGRNHALNDAAFRVAQLVHTGVMPPSAMTTLAEAGRAVGLSQREVSATIMSAMTGAASKPRLPVQDRPMEGGLRPPPPSREVGQAPLPPGLLRPFERVPLDLTTPVVDPERLAPGIYAGCLTSLSAPPGSGKGWVALDWTLRIIRQGYSVVYLDGENGPAIMHGRLKRMGATPEEVNQALWLVCDRGRPWDLEDAAAMSALCVDAAAAAPKGLGMVVLDTMAHFLAEAGRSENDATDVTSWVDRFARIPQRDQGAAVVWLDHVPKPTSDRPNLHAYARGSGSKLGLVDVGLVLDVVCPFNAHTSGEFRLFAAKDRTGTCEIPFLSAACPDPGEGQAVAVNVSVGLGGLPDTTRLRYMPGSDRSF